MTTPSAKKLFLCFEVGQKLTLKNTTYTITGIVGRSDPNLKNVHWREYFLEDIAQKQAFLSEYNGNWLLTKKLDNPSPSVLPSFEKVFYEDVEYLLFQEYFQKTDWSEGQFDYDVYQDTFYSKEYVAPPYILINEIENDEKSEWYKGEHVSHHDLEAQHTQLGNVSTFPHKVGVGAVEPYSGKFKYRDAMTISAVAWSLLIFVQLFFLIISPTRTIFTENYSMTDLPMDSADARLSATKKPFISKSFEVPKTSKMEIILLSNIDNSWLESTITMINEKTGEQLPIVIENEFYSGVEDGSSWTEGSTEATKDFSSVPQGRYHLLVDAVTPVKNNGSFTITLKTGGVYWSNLLILMVLIAIIPIVLHWKERNFETKRWADSDFSPYNVTEE